MGDKLPSEFLDHLYSLLPDPKVLFEICLLDALPANARIAALQHSDVRAMARAADQVVLENRAAAEFSGTVAAANAITLDDDNFSQESLPPPLVPTPAPALLQASVAAVSGRRPRPPYRKTDTLCAVHNRWGRDAYRCLTPATCKMHVIRPKPPTPSASGNGRAGGQ